MNPPRKRVRDSKCKQGFGNHLHDASPGSAQLKTSPRPKTRRPKPHYCEISPRASKLCQCAAQSQDEADDNHFQYPNYDYSAF